MLIAYTSGGCNRTSERSSGLGNNYLILIYAWQYADNGMIKKFPFHNSSSKKVDPEAPGETKEMSTTFVFQYVISTTKDSEDVCILHMKHPEVYHHLGMSPSITIKRISSSLPSFQLNNSMNEFISTESQINAASAFGQGISTSNCLNKKKGISSPLPSLSYRRIFDTNERLLPFSFVQ
ncbi:hypothetical protein DAPPUDRAFT_316823 [Daphnia pulex]|uniref:Uncharacterized protein n=1 Tax=Daphnia pulex TaxID=6669 RepID=E9GE38_DAPPU|nr:hypothetical protein DAPPUDRAFT_316823 [Daphnia pulex]|eukprot:EFX82384.1 hypothetical protein DAPPUDRAFT_316823 [Daphnia pulex]